MTDYSRAFTSDHPHSITRMIAAADLRPPTIGMVQCRCGWQDTFVDTSFPPVVSESEAVIRMVGQHTVHVTDTANATPKLIHLADIEWIP